MVHSDESNKDLFKSDSNKILQEIHLKKERNRSIPENNQKELRIHKFPELSLRMLNDQVNLKIPRISLIEKTTPSDTLLTPIFS